MRHEEATSKAIMMVGGIVLALLLVTLAFILFGKTEDAADTAGSKIDDMTARLETGDYTSLSGKTDISGSTVQSFLKNHKNDVTFIKVITQKDKSGTYYNYSGEDVKEANKIDVDKNNKAIEKANTKSSDKYINPAAKFTAEVKYGSDGSSVLGITFTQN